MRRYVMLNSWFIDFILWCARLFHTEYKFFLTNDQVNLMANAYTKRNMCSKYVSVQRTRTVLRLLQRKIMYLLSNNFYLKNTNINNPEEMKTFAVIVVINHRKNMLQYSYPFFNKQIKQISATHPSWFIHVPNI